MNELKPCECGRPAKMQDAKIIDGKATRWFARCESAYCWYGPERDSRERAAESWNRRMSPEAHAEAGERPTEFSVPDTIAERVDRVMREARLKVREYIAKESANLKPLDLNQVYAAPPASAGTEGPGLREALEKVTVRMNKVTARWRHTRSIAKAEMDALCNIQLEAEAALARLEGEKQ